MLFTSSDYALSVDDDADSADVDQIAAWAYSRLLRESFNFPGFVLIQFSPSIGSTDLRRIMVELKRKLSDIHREKTSRELCYRSMGRFNQQTTTKFHLDGAP